MSLPNRDFTESFEENFMGDQDLFFGVVKIFQAQHREYLSKLSGAIQTQNRPEIKAWSHKIKGSISHFHHMNPVQMAQKIEELSPTASFETLSEHFSTLEQHMKVLREDLQAITEQMNKAAA